MLSCLSGVPPPYNLVFLYVVSSDSGKEKRSSGKIEGGEAPSSVERSENAGEQSKPDLELRARRALKF